MTQYDVLNKHIKEILVDWNNERQNQPEYDGRKPYVRTIEVMVKVLKEALTLLVLACVFVAAYYFLRRGV